MVIDVDEEKLDALSFKEALAYSIVAESVSKNAYEEFADNAVGELNKARFESLAEDEEMHRNELKKIYRKKFGEEEIQYPKGKDLPRHEADVDIRTTQSMVDSLKVARQNELNAYDVYKYLAKNHDMYRDIFEYLAVMEWGHYESLKEEIDLYTDEIENNPATKTKDPFEISWKQTSYR